MEVYRQSVSSRECDLTVYSGYSLDRIFLFPDMTNPASSSRSFTSQRLYKQVILGEDGATKDFIL